MRIMLIRHFQTPGNLERRYVGRTDEPLLENEGLVRLAEEKRACFQRRGMPDRVIASPMRRCIQTAELIFPGAAPVLCAEMRECDFGLFEGKNYEELKELAAYQEWLDSRGTIPFPDGEGHEAFRTRCVKGFENMVSELAAAGSRTAAMVVHGGTIMAVLSGFGPDGSGFYDWQVENGGGFLVSLDEIAWDMGQKEFREIERL